MRILRVIASMDPTTGGPCRGIRNSVEAMQPYGIVNEVVSLDRPDAPFLGSDNFTIIPLGSGRNPWAYSAKLIPWLTAHLGAYDAVIVHGLWLFPGVAVKKAMDRISANQRPPWFLMPHGMLDPYFQNAPSRKAKALRNKVYWALFEHKVIEAATGVLFTCIEEEMLARATFKPYRPKRTINIGYGIQPPPSLCAEMKTDFLNALNRKFVEPYFLFLSRIHPKKGLDMLIDAYANYASGETLTDSVPNLVIAGPGLETDFGKTIKNKVASDPFLKEKVIFSGMLSGNAKWGAFYHAEAFILPSHQENFGIAVAEALACSTPVLISNKINIWREIEAVGGGLVRPDTEAGTSALLSDWIALSTVEKEKKKEAAYSAYVGYFEINTIIKTLINVLSDKFVSKLTKNHE